MACSFLSTNNVYTRRCNYLLQQDRQVAATNRAQDGASPSSSLPSADADTCPLGSGTRGSGSHRRRTRSNDRSHTAHRAHVVSLLQLNLNKSRPPTAGLNRTKFDVALVQEPPMGAGARVSYVDPPRRSFGKEKARAAVIVDTEKVHYWPMESLSNRDLAAVMLIANGRSNLIVAASCYCDIKLEVVTPAMKKLVDFCSNRKIPMVIGMDSNAHSSLWGEENTNGRGVELESWLMEANLTLLNRGRVPTFVPLNGSRSTIIDLTLVNEWALEVVGEWAVDMEPSLSDHRMIRYNLHKQLVMENKTRRVYRKANWENFKEELEWKEFTWLAADHGVDRIAEGLHDDLQRALDRAAPVKKQEMKPKNTWWSEKLTLKRRILKNVYRKRQVHGRVQEKYKELKRDFSEEIKRAKSQAWRSFCSKAESAKDIARLVQILENPPARMMSLLQDGEVLTPDESIEHLLLTHFPGGKLGDQSTSDDDDTGPMDLTGICQYIDDCKVQAAFASFGDYKSPGPDELPPIALKKLTRNFLKAIAILYKLVIATGSTPRLWRKMRVVFIPKVGKADYAVAKAYRPITLSNFILKGLERVVQWYILETVITSPLSNQHAYTKGRSCDSALSYFVDDVERSIYNGQYLLAVSLDCSGAFDSIHFEAASRCMKNSGIPKNIIQWYDKLLKGRCVSAKIQGLSRRVRPSRGSPQGGVLSPLVWNIIMDSFLSKFNTGAVRALGYADDILLYISGINITEMEEILQPVITQVSNWGITNGLMFNPTKTQMVMFTRRRGSRAPSLTMGNVALEANDYIKYLGIEIHKSLSWNRHVTARVNKCKGLLFKCKSIIHRSWGLTPAKIEWIYKAIIRPKLSYGSIVWGHRLTLGARKKLVGLQRLALVATVQPLRSSPTAGLEVMMGWTPLDLHIKEIGLNTFARLQDSHRNNWDHVGTQKRLMGHLGLWKKELSRLYPVGYPRGEKLSARMWIPDNHSEWNRYFPQPIRIYTDASRSRDNVGLGWLTCDGDYVITCGSVPMKEINVYHAEMLAIKEALSWIKEEGSRDRWYIIYTDSESAACTLRGQMAKDFIAKETMCLLRELGKKCYIQIQWIKGHAGNVGNLIADKLAQEGMEEAKKLSYTSPFMPICAERIKKTLKEVTIKRWQERWDTLTSCKISKLFKPEVGLNKHITTMGFEDLSELSQIITGHGLFKRHLRHWNEIGDVQCSLCQEDQESSWHLWEFCPRLQESRKLVASLRKQGISYEKTLLRFFHQQELVELKAHNEASLGV